VCCGEGVTRWRRRVWNTLRCGRRECCCPCHKWNLGILVHENNEEWDPVWWVLIGSWHPLSLLETSLLIKFCALLLAGGGVLWVKVQCNVVVFLVSFRPMHVFSSLDMSCHTLILYVFLFFFSDNNKLCCFTSTRTSQQLHQFLLFPNIIYLSWCT